MVYELLGTSLIHPEDWQRLNSLERERVLRATDKAKALSMLVDQGLLTQYQSARISAGTTFGLVMGNYRVLDRIGAGGDGRAGHDAHGLARFHFMMPTAAGR